MNNILPKEIESRLNSHFFDMDLTLVSTACNQRWPKCKISLNDREIFNGAVVSEHRIKLSQEFVENSVDIKITIYDKTDRDTLVNADGAIIENQNISIKEFKLNDIDIIKNNVIYHGLYVMDLPDSKIKYLEGLGILTTNHDYHFYENGTWTLQVRFPVLTHIINSTKQLETFEQIPYNNILNDIIKKLGV